MQAVKLSKVNEIKISHFNLFLILGFWLANFKGTNYLFVSSNNK